MTDKPSDAAHDTQTTEKSRNLKRIAKTLSRDSRRSKRKREVEQAMRDHHDIELVDYDLGRVLFELSCRCDDNRAEILREINGALGAMYGDNDVPDEQRNQLSKATLYKWLKEEPTARYSD